AAPGATERPGHASVAEGNVQIRASARVAPARLHGAGADRHVPELPIDRERGAPGGAIRIEAAALELQRRDARRDAGAAAPERLELLERSAEVVGRQGVERPGGAARDHACPRRCGATQVEGDGPLL